MSNPGLAKGMNQAPPEAASGVRPGRSVFSGIRWSAVQLAFSSGIRLIRGTVIPKLLVPAAYGLSNSALIPMNYVRYTDLGILDQLAKRLPLLLGETGEQAYREEAGRGAAWILATSLLGAVGLFAFSFWFRGEHAAFYRTAIRLVAVISVLFKFRFFLNVTLYAREDYRQYNLGPMCADGSGLLATIPFVIWLGPIGVLWGLLCSESIATFYTARKAGLPRLRLEPRKMLRMAREGIVLLLVSLTEVTMMTVDQLFLVRFFPVAQFGLYSLGLFMTSALMMGASVFLLANSRILRLAGAGKEEEANRLLGSILSLHGLLVAVGIALSVPLMSLVIRLYLPRYAAGITLYVLLAGLAIVRGPMILLRPIFLAKNRERGLIARQLAGLGLIVLLDALVVSLHGGLAAVAAASFCGYGLSTLLLAADFERGVKDPLKSRVSRYIFMLASGLICLGLYAWYRWHPPTIPGLQYSGIALQAFTFAALPILALSLVFRPELTAAVRLTRRVEPAPAPTAPTAEAETFITRAGSD